MTSSLTLRDLGECLLGLGRGQSPTYVEDESPIHAINQKCVRNGVVNTAYSRAHDPLTFVKDFAVLQDGDVCINSTGTGTIGRVGLWAQSSSEADRSFADSHVTIARPNTTVVNSRYLTALLQSPAVQTAMETYCFSGSTNQIELNKTALSYLKLSLLSRDEQDVVAEAITDIDRATEQTEALIAKQRRIKTGLMQDLLTKGIDEHGNVRSEATHAFKDSQLGRIPVEWEARTLGEVVHVIDPNPSHRYPPTVDEGVPIASTENFLGDSDFDLSRAEFVPNEVFYAQNARCAFEPNDVVFARKGRIGLARPYGTEKKVFSHTVVVLKPLEPDFQARFILWSVRFDRFFDEINKRMNSNSGVPTLGVGFIQAIPIPVPKKEERESIVLVLDEHELKARSAAQLLEKLKRIRAGLMHDLLTGKSRVTSLLAKAAAQ